MDFQTHMPQRSSPDNALCVHSSQFHIHHSKSQRPLTIFAPIRDKESQIPCCQELKHMIDSDNEDLTHSMCSHCDCRYNRLPLCVPTLDDLTSNCYMSWLTNSTRPD